ncbi:unnamed protein product [Plutella xylostella]|uniref:(diamondback moth) hypothetical protein n=1 Tax=Plutella xylostella TaxID=51655 RepID=A0A8S4EIH8_PLUXY|nr:unnamed protein product [Plutella xylostella]
MIESSVDVTAARRGDGTFLFSFSPHGAPAAPPPPPLVASTTRENTRAFHSQKLKTLFYCVKYTLWSQQKVLLMKEGVNFQFVHRQRNNNNTSGCVRTRGAWMATLTWRSLALLLATLSVVLAKYAELQPWRGAGRPATAAQEAEDERRDAELLGAVRASMKEWEMKRGRTRMKRSQGSVCYGEFGCFEDAGPFAYLETLPSSPQEVGTHFLLYSTIARGDQPLLAVSASNMSAAWGWAARAFDSARPTRVIVHGFGSNCDNVWVYEMRSALMAVEECNVVCVDWEGGATMPNYLRAAANTRLVGKQLAMLLKGLAKHIALRFEDVHLIGFSLGAHVAGFAGSELGNISRITGLDPAGPLFEFQDPRARLDRSDAKFVDVIHSNGETLIFGGLGAAQPLGHVDFYPNGGRVQHGCSNLFVGAVSDLVLPWAAPSPEGRSLCNHRRAYKFFTDSVSPKCHFPAFPCADYDTFLEGRCFPCDGDRRCGNMGYYADRSLGRGQLYLLTREEEPFCGEYHCDVSHRVIDRRCGNMGYYADRSLGRGQLYLLTREEEPFCGEYHCDVSHRVIDRRCGNMGYYADRSLGRGQLYLLTREEEPFCGEYHCDVSHRVIDRRCGNMGYYADRSLGRGQLYLLTREEEPFCAHQYHVSVWGGSGEKQNYGRVTLTLHGDSGLNESFPMTKREDSQPPSPRFTRVIVPHPALGVPLRATVHYAAYNGWLTAGAKAIRIDKLLIADSFGKTSSFCKKGLDLMSEESVELPLYPGDCEIQEEDDNSTSTAQVYKKPNGTKSPPMDLEDNELPEDAPQRPFLLVDTSEWTGADTGRAFGMTNTKTAPSGVIEIAEPVLRPRAKKAPRQRADTPEEQEISEPLVRPTHSPKPTTAAVRKAKNYDMSTTPAYEAMNYGERANEKEETSFVVQYLPSRLASFISRAERYARDTLLPLVSAYAPRLPIFGSRDNSRPVAKYIPTEESNTTSSVPVPTPTLEVKIVSLRSVGPPEKRFEESPEDPIVMDTTTTTAAPSTTTTEKLRTAASEVLKVVNAPTVSTSTALPPVALRGEKEKIVIVYPSNARDERKIRSHSYPEELQFEALYRHTAGPVRVDLPTFPPTTALPATSPPNQDAPPHPSAQ